MASLSSARELEQLVFNMDTVLKNLAKDLPLTALCVGAIIWLVKSLLAEKDKEIKQAKDDEQKVTLVLGEVDSTLQAILIDLKHHHHDETEEKTTT